VVDAAALVGIAVALGLLLPRRLPDAASHHHDPCDGLMR
jgi:hypothetical protein